MSFKLLLSTVLALQLGQVHAQANDYRDGDEDASSHPYDGEHATRALVHASILKAIIVVGSVGGVRYVELGIVLAIATDHVSNAVVIHHAPLLYLIIY